jgi:putative peptidoglycan lipid II flippase
VPDPSVPNPEEQEHNEIPKSPTEKVAAAQAESEAVAAEAREAVNEQEADDALAVQGGLLRNSAVMAAGSILSRITGVMRDMALTAALGLYITADAFALGNSLPSIVYVLVIGGALNAIFVPQFVRRMKDDADGGKAYTDSLLTVAGAILVVVTVLAVALAPFIVGIYATPDFTQQQLDLAISFARFCLPQIFFFGLYTMLAQVLNARGHFAMPMFAPILNNLVAIATYLSFALVVGAAASGGGLTDSQTAWLGIGTTLGIVVQSLVLIPVLKRAGYSWKLSRTWRGMGLRKAGRLAGWTLGLVAVAQVSYAVVTRLATQANVNAAELSQPPAGLAAYNRAYLVFMIPHGIVTVSIVTAQLPSLSRIVHRGSLHKAGGEIGYTMRLVATLISPIALALLLTSGPLSAVLFNYGVASREQASQLGVVIAAFMLGLLPFTLYYVLQRGWYAMENTRTPFLFAVFMNVVFVVLMLAFYNLASPGAPQVTALALAYSVANWLMFLAAWPAIRRSYGFVDGRATAWTLVRVGIAGVLAVLANSLIHLAGLPSFTIDESKLVALFDIFTTSLIVFVVFVAAAWLLRITELRDLVKWVAVKSPIRLGS